MSVIEVKPISPIIGADVDAGDLRRLSAAGWAELKQAVYDHQVVLIRGQDLDDDALQEVISHFGEPLDLGHNGLIGELAYVSTFAISPEKPPIADNWHTDDTYLATPPAFGLLYNIVAPEAGGDTMWSSNYAAYNALSPAFQELCRGLMCVHGPGPGIYEYIKKHGTPEKLARFREEFGGAEHPLVIRHPHTGRLALFMTDNFLERIVGLKPQEEQLLIAHLRRLYDNPNHQARMRWKPGALAIWDQRATNHRGLSDHFPAHPYRTMKSSFIMDGIPTSELLPA